MAFTCVDLFTGIAGLQAAFRGLMRPFVYCDIDPNVRAVLQRLMQSDKIPRAPIVHDVRKIEEICGHVPEGTELDFVLATPSCKGFSTANSMQPGIDHEETSLILCVVSIVAKLRPHAVFIENTPGIATQLHRIQMQGYVLTSAVFSAEGVGAPHVRRRWYGLYIREGSDIQVRLQDALRNHECYRPNWSIHAEPQHITDMPYGVRYNVASARVGMLGNSVVPLCAHDALCELVGVPRMRDAPHPRRMRLDPNLAETPRHAYAKQPAIPGPIEKERFPTPRYSIRRSCNRLIERVVSDLPTFLRFWDAVSGPRLGFINPHFVEWLMGYPRNWTDFTVDFQNRPQAPPRHLTQEA